MEINSKDELKSALDEIMARLSVIEQSGTEKRKMNQKKTIQKKKNPKLNQLMKSKNFLTLNIERK
jgi:hypothetical protein